MDKIKEQIYEDDLISPDDEIFFAAICGFLKKWSLGCGSIFGIPVRVHLLNILWLGLIFYFLNDYNLIRKCIVIFSVIFALLSHEIAHALVARYFGNAVKWIVLILPLGAVALIGFKEDKPIKGLAITIAGPLVNLLTALAIFLFQSLISTEGHYYPYYSYHFYWRFLLEFIFYFSLGMGAFNLIPLYPMDGGQLVNDFMLLCKAGDRTADIVTLSISLVSFAGLFIFSIKTVNVILLIFVSIMVTIVIYEFHKYILICFQKIRQLMNAKPDVIKQ